MSVDKEDVTVLIPTLNEEESIGIVLDEVEEAGFENVLVVDGYSDDDTVKIAEEKGARVVTQSGEGKTEALRTGVKFINTPYMLVLDADHTYDPADSERMLELGEEYDYIIGCREDRENIGLLHRFGNWMISFVFSLLLGQSLTDPCSGMYLSSVEKVQNSEFYGEGFELEVELAMKMSAHGEVGEVPIKYRERIGESKLSTVGDFLNIIRAAFRTAWLYNPIFLLSGFSGVFSIPGIIILLWQFIVRYFQGTTGAWSLGWALFGLVLVIIGFQGLTLAGISLMMKRMERRFRSEVSENG